MKTTLDLPDDLIVEIKQRAVREGMKLNDAVADLLRKGIVAFCRATQNSFLRLMTTKAVLNAYGNRHIVGGTLSSPAMILS